MRTFSDRVKGYFFGILSAVCYGLNPLGALHLYQEGVNVNSVLFYRYALAAVILAVVMFFRKGEKISSGRREVQTMSILGVLFAISSLTLYAAYTYMGSGIASTLLFVYPILVAVLMAVLFREKITVTTFSAVLLSVIGVALLYRGDDGEVLNGFGVLLVMMSSLSYAIYIIVVNRAKLKVSSFKLTFYVLLSGTLFLLLVSMLNPAYHIQMLPSFSALMWALMIAVVPTIISLLAIVLAIRLIGSTPTAIMGALEPVTAVVIGIFVFDEPFTFRLGLGICFILSAVILIVLRKNRPARN